MTSITKNLIHQIGHFIKKARSSALVRQNCKKHGPKGSANSDSMIKVDENIDPMIKVDENIDPMIKVEQGIDSIIDDSVPYLKVDRFCFTCEIHYLLDYFKQYKSEWTPRTRKGNALEMMHKILTQVEKPLSDEEVKANVKEYMNTATFNVIRKMMSFCSERQFFKYDQAFEIEFNKTAGLFKTIMDSVEECNIQNSKLHVKAIKYLSELPSFALNLVKIILTSDQDEDMVYSRMDHLPVSMIVNLANVHYDERFGLESLYYEYALDEEALRIYVDLISNIQDEHMKISVNKEKMLTEAKKEALEMVKDVLDGKKDPTDENATLFAVTGWGNRDEIGKAIQVILAEDRNKLTPKINHWVQIAFNFLYRTAGLKKELFDHLEKLRNPDEKTVTEK